MIASRDTIFALATPPGISGIGVIKISGPKAKDALKKVFRGKRDPISSPRKMTLGEVIDPSSGKPIDKVLAVYMPAPNSYTGEDVVEIQAHGGIYVLNAIMEILQRIGLRTARGGEFTLRAFLNGKMDLTQAEAVLDIVHARSRKSMEVSTRILEGDLRKRIESLRNNIKGALVEIEPQLDFPEDEVVYDKCLVLDLLKKAIDDISHLVSTYRAGRILKEGATITICGLPNVGKSSLFNRIVGRERSIVTSIPGTTRDYIEEELFIGSLPVKVVDTAGIRDVMDPVEKEGVRRAREKIKKSDLIIFIFDLSREPLSEEFRFVDDVTGEGKEVIKVGNKLDLFSGDIPPYVDIAVSAKTGNGLDRLVKMIEDKILGTDVMHEEVLLTSSRQKVALEDAMRLLKKAVSRVEADGELDLAAEDIKEAVRKVSEITGDIAPEEVINDIFDKFCIGK